ncbi:MAG: 16S rRNA (guanine(527)-N(7))-methyltransferase RsmG [Acetobacteraceae bacterium]
MQHSSTRKIAQREALERFAALLLRWNRTVNLIARGDESLLWGRHIADSLDLVPLIQDTADRGIDLGSGAGFPGLIIALATGIPFDLIEADHRKAAFLREAARITGAPVTIHCSRIEAITLQPAPLVTARALAPLPALLRLAAPKLAAGGVVLLPKGETSAAELTAARREWQMNAERIPGRRPGTVVLKISELHPVSSSA